MGLVWGDNVSTSAKLKTHFKTLRCLRSGQHRVCEFYI